MGRTVQEVTKAKATYSEDHKYLNVDGQMCVTQVNRRYKWVLVLACGHKKIVPISTKNAGAAPTAAFCKECE